MSAEGSARRTAAAAVLSDFRTASDKYAFGITPSPDWMMWSLRLAAELQSVLAQLDAEDKQ